MNDHAHLGEVLIVEDTPASLKLLSDLLAGAGYAVRQAPDGELALWSAQSRPPELILLDVRMPGIDGFEVCRRLKASPELSAIPVIFLSAQSDTDDRLRGFQAGGIDFIGKPYQADEVLARAAAHLGLARSQRALAAANAELTATLGQLDATREELRRAERLAALGAMVAGIAHELNTPIGNCVLAASTLEQSAQSFAQETAGPLRRSQLDRFVGDSLLASELILRNLASTARLIDSFKRVATDQAASQRCAFDLGALLADALAPFAARLDSAGVDLVVSAPSGLAMQSYPDTLAQVLNQLVSNCLVHAFGEHGGALRIDAACEDGRASVTVSDNGRGIASADLARVFEPFFTTRMGQGSNGLGLHIAHNLVTNVLGGTLVARSSDGETCFTLQFPCVAPALTGRPSPPIDA
ncbi:MAG: sensor histidine kinase [Massilia sp.]